MLCDILFVVGDEIIEVLMVWWFCFFEYCVYRFFLKEYFKEGVKWMIVFKFFMCDVLYD